MFNVVLAFKIMNVTFLLRTLKCLWQTKVCLLWWFINTPPPPPKKNTIEFNLTAYNHYHMKYIFGKGSRLCDCENTIDCLNNMFECTWHPTLSISPHPDAFLEECMWHILQTYIAKYIVNYHFGFFCGSLGFCHRTGSDLFLCLLYGHSSYQMLLGLTLKRNNAITMLEE